MNNHSYNHLYNAIALVLSVILSSVPLSGAEDVAPDYLGTADDGLLLMRRTFGDKLEDITMTNHRGERVKFFSDLVRGRIVLISFFYTNCQDSCPLTNRKMAVLRRMMREEFGRSATLISISVDPERDTPAVIAKYAKQQTFETADPDMPDWQFLTGDAAEIARLRRMMGKYEFEEDADLDPAKHGSSLMIGNQATGRWCMLNGRISTEGLMTRIRRIAGWTEQQRYHDMKASVHAWDAFREGRGPNPLGEMASDAEPPVLDEVSEALAATTQSGRELPWDAMRGKVRVVTSLYMPCGHGSAEGIELMKQLNIEFGKNPDFQQIVIPLGLGKSVASALGSLAKSWGLQEKGSCLLAGVKPEHYRLFAVRSLGLEPPSAVAPQNRVLPADEVEYDLRTVLIDQNGRVRGRFQVNDADPARSALSGELLRRDIRFLLNQKNQRPIN
jgi:protein SCO1/2